MFTKGWLQSRLTEEVSVPVSTPAPENRLLVPGRNLSWLSLLWVTTASPFSFTLMRGHWTIIGSSQRPSLEGTIQSMPVGWYLRWSGLWKWVELPPRLNQWAQGGSLFRVLYPVSSSHLAFMPGVAVNWNWEAMKIHTGGRGEGRAHAVPLVSHSCLSLRGIPTPNKISSCFLWCALTGNARSTLGRKQRDILKSTRKWQQSAPSFWW